MKMIFLLKVLSPENETFERDYEIPYDSTLLDLHQWIAEDLGFDADEMASIFISDGNWSKLQEFTSEDMNFGEDDTDIEELVPMYMGDITLGQILKQKHERMLYVFDLLANRGLYIELIKSFKDEQKNNYPHTAISVGEAPIQIDEDIVGDEVSEMFDDMYEDGYEDEFDEFGNDSYKEEYY